MYPINLYVTRTYERAIRKLRWAGSGRGKRGGIRAIYFWRASAEANYILTAYAKSDRDDLTAADRKAAMVGSTVVLADRWYPSSNLFLLRFGCARTGPFAADLPLRLVRPRDRPRSQRRQESRRIGRKLCGDCLWRNALWRAGHPSVGGNRSRATGSVEAGTGQQRPGLWSGTARSALRRSRQGCVGSGERLSTRQHIVTLVSVIDIISLDRGSVDCYREPWK